MSIRQLQKVGRWLKQEINIKNNTKMRIISSKENASVPDEKEDPQSENSKNHLYSELNEGAKKANYIKYSPDKLVRGQFGKIMYGKENIIEYVLLSDRFLDRELLEGYFYLLRIQTVSCGGFWRGTGERSESCKVIEMEDIDETTALERYNQFLNAWKE